MFGDYGGVVEVLMTLSSFLVAPVASHAFNLKAISKLFLVKTQDDTLLPNRTNDKTKKKQMNEKHIKKALEKKLQNSFTNHRFIKFNLSQRFWLLFLENIGQYFTCCLDLSQNKLYRLYSKGVDQIEKELDIVKILRGLRNVKIYNQLTGMSN